MSLDNQIAIVTGGGQGIGEQIALRLACEGAALIIAFLAIEWFLRKRNGML